MTHERGIKLLRIAMVLLMSTGIAACGGESESEADTAGESSMAAQSEERGEGEGEHGREGGEREGGDREGEHEREGGEGEEGEHGGEGAHDEGEEDEEPGIYIARADTWDMTRRGARLVLSFNAQTGAFVGRVENTTSQRLCAVRVEVHLANGPELGPTERTNVPAGGTLDVALPAEGASFETWTAHPEMSACEGL